MTELVTTLIGATFAIPGWVLTHRAKSRPHLAKMAKTYVYTYCIATFLAGAILIWFFNLRGSAMIGLAFGCSGWVDNLFNAKQASA